MKNVKQVGKIVLSKETLRQLDDRELPDAVGGAYTIVRCPGSNANHGTCLSNCQC